MHYRELTVARLRAWMELDYQMIRSLSVRCKLLLLDIYNELFLTRVIPESWRYLPNTINQEIRWSKF